MDSTPAANATFSVYVIELKPEVLKHRKFVYANPDHDPSMACLYVGMTSKTPEERYEDHEANRKANSYVYRYHLRLRKRLYQRLNPMTYQQAVEEEVALAERLRKKGYAVWQK